MQNSNFIKERYALYLDGLTDEEISKIQHVERNSITCWRSRNGLSPNRDSKSKQYKELNARRRLMIEKGYTDERMAICEHVTIHSIKEWKWRNGNKKKQSHTDPSTPGR